MKVLSILLGFILISTWGIAQVEWAKEVIGFSSEKGSSSYPGQLMAKEILGKPSIMVPQVNNGCAWAPLQDDNVQPEWIHLKFNPIKCQQIAVLESNNPGSISKIWFYDNAGKEYLIYENSTPKAEGTASKLFIHTFPLTTYAVVSVKIQLNTAAVPGENQLDAVALSSSSTPIEVKINTSSEFLSDYKPENLGQNVNSTTEDLCPVISPDGKSLYFIRQSHPNNIGNINNQDTWLSTLDVSGAPSLALNVGSPLNNGDNNGLVSITPDGQKALMINVYLPDGTMEKGVSMATKVNGEWTLPVKVNIEDFYNDNMYGEYFLLSSGNAIIMTVQRKEGYGAKDLYISFLKDGIWTKPLNMGKDLNTAASETSPFLAADGVTLYFSTKGRPGYGGNDMFVSRRLDDSWTKWSEPQNLGPSLNTPTFDAYYSIPANGEYAYFVSYQNSLGGADIFRMKLPQALRPKPVVLIKGRVLNAETGLPIGAKIAYEDLTKDKIVGEALSDGVTGEYSIILPSGATYGFLGNADGYFAVSENLDLSKLSQYKEITRDIKLVPLKKGQTIRLNNIFFDTGKFTLRKESRSELARLIKLLKENPTMKIEIQGHTDDVGADADNLTLSKNRAKAVYDYLIKNGIEASRLISKGFGETKPLVANSSAENRQMNRRVEFVIIEL